MNAQKEIEEALDRLKCAQTPDEIRKAVAIAEMIKLLIEERNAATNK